MAKTHVLFGACFLILSTAGALLLTWSIWWVSVVGSSVPARRPFFRPQKDVPDLVKDASNVQAKDIFVYSLPGGWPTVNSLVRIVAALLAVFASFSFAFIATLAKESTSRLIFTIVLFLTLALSLGSAVLDCVSLIKTSAECNARKCITAVPPDISSSKNFCKCSPDGWFWVTLAVDLVLFTSAVVCVVLTMRPILGRRTRTP